MNDRHWESSIHQGNETMLDQTTTKSEQVSNDSFFCPICFPVNIHQTQSNAVITQSLRKMLVGSVVATAQRHARIAQFYH